MDFIIYILTFIKDWSGLGAVLGLIIIIYQIKENKKARKIERTYQLMDRFWIHILEKSTSINFKDEVPEDKESDEYTKYYNERLFVASYFIELSEYWFNNSIDKDIVLKTMFSNVITSSYTRALPFIENEKRMTDTSNMFSKWDSLYKDVVKTKSNNNLKFDFLSWLYEIIHNNNQ